MLLRKTLIRGNTVYEACSATIVLLSVTNEHGDNGVWSITTSLTICQVCTVISNHDVADCGVTGPEEYRLDAWGIKPEIYASGAGN